MSLSLPPTQALSKRRRRSARTYEHVRASHGTCETGWLARSCKVDEAGVYVFDMHQLLFVIFSVIS